MFGGLISQNSNKLLNDVHLFNLEKMIWTQVDVKGTPPEPRGAHTASLVGNRLYIIGGVGKNEVYSDVHILDINIMEWLNIPIKKGYCDPLAGHAAAVLGKTIYLYGGFYANQMNPTNRFSSFDTEKMEWNQIKINGASPKIVSFPGLHAVDNKLILFGGIDKNSDSNLDLYIYYPENNIWTWPFTRNDFLKNSHSPILNTILGNSLITISENIGVLNLSNELEQLEWTVGVISEKIDNLSFCTTTPVDGKVYILKNGFQRSDSLFNLVYVLDTGMLEPPSLQNLCIGYISKMIEKLDTKSFINFPESLQQKIFF